MTKVRQPDIRSLSEDELIARFQQMEQPSFRAKQVHQWLWQKMATSFHEMTNLPKSLRSRLEEQFDIRTIEVADEQHSTDGTIKFGFRVFDGELIEGVLIPQGDRMTACISSQVGCSLTCKFCATASIDRKRNLDFFEIYDQVKLIDKAARAEYGRGLSNIVYMGMGEPLLNYANVVKSIRAITSPEGMGMSPKRITLSSVGIAKMITRLADEGLGIHLAISLHAANDEKRSVIMPINETNSTQALKDALKYWVAKTSTLITQEYVMLAKFNETEQDARELAAFCREVPSKINLIEYNPIDNAIYERSSNNRAMAFKRALEAEHMIVNIRRSRGKDIDAACGQLANKNSLKATGE